MSLKAIIKCTPLDVREYRILSRLQLQGWVLACHSWHKKRLAQKLFVAKSEHCLILQLALLLKRVFVSVELNIRFGVIFAVAIDLDVVR